MKSKLKLKLKSKSLIRQRREVRAVCDICRSPDYKQLLPYFKGGKPNFECNGCGHMWQSGYNGGIYSKLSKEVVRGRMINE